jgi:hypothetical protein
MKLSRDGRYPTFTLLARQSDNYRIALKAGDAAPGPNYIVRQSTLSSRSSQNGSKAIWEVFARALQGMETPLDVRLVKMARVVMNRDWSAARLVGVRFTANSGHVQYT